MKRVPQEEKLWRNALTSQRGSVATLKTVAEEVEREGGRLGCSQQRVRTARQSTDSVCDIILADPSRWPSPDYVHRLVSMNRSPRCPELAKTLLGLQPSFDRSMILLEDIVQISNGSISAEAALKTGANAATAFAGFCRGP
jgi:hypothetical protein